MEALDGQFLQRMWRVPVYLPYLQPELTDEAVRDAEQSLGVTLPRDYVQLLRVQNGGYLRFYRHPDADGAVDKIYGIGPFLPSILGKDWEDVKATMEEDGATTPQQIDDLIPFCGDGHYHICLDFRTSGCHGEPCITYVDVESFDTDRVLAPNFATFLRQLQGDPDEPNAIGVVTTEGIETVAAALGTLLSREVEDVGDQSKGYRVFRIKLAEPHSWLWLEANYTRKGFVRRNHGRYDTLCAQMPEIVPRYSEHGDCSCLITVSADDPAGRQAVEALAKLPWPTRYLDLSC